jgi:hypothetical protein
MNLLDLIKATVTCGGSAFLIYSFPYVTRWLVIGVLTVLWLSYAFRTVNKLLKR